MGSAIASGFGLHADIKIYDVSPQKTMHSFEETVNSDFVFVCVPTPMSIKNKNEIDLSIINSVFQRISKLPTLDNEKTIFIIKSTAIPGTTSSLAEAFPSLNIVFNPEFLTERAARLDFINASRIVLGGPEQLCNRVEDMYRVRFPYTKIVKTDSTTAEFIKYMCNTFFATKISFMNELKQLSDKLNLDWDKAMEGFVSDGRIGNSHLDVPGHDGSVGFGGKCFPKDLNAMINFFACNNVDPKVLTAVWEKNLEVRSDHDWKDIEGATS